MRSQEFVKEVRKDKIGKYINDALKSAGYKKLGSGMDASVWMKDEGTIVKIIMPAEDPTESISRMELFYKFVKANPNLKHLPKFKKSDGHEVFEFEIGGIPFLQFSMEQLHPLKNNSLDEYIIWFMSDYADKDWNSLYTKLPKLLYDEVSKEYSEMFKKLPNEKIQDYKDLFSTIKLLKKLGKKYKFGWDLHTDNVMRRNDGTLVVTDPWA